MLSEQQSENVFIVIAAFVIIKRYHWIAYQRLLPPGWSDFIWKKNDVKQKEISGKENSKEARNQDFFFKRMTSICLPCRLQRYNIV